MDNKINKSNISKNYFPSIVHITEDKTNIDVEGNMQEEPTVTDVLNDKIVPPSPHTPSL